MSLLRALERLQLHVSIWAWLPPPPGVPTVAVIAAAAASLVVPAGAPLTEDVAHAPTPTTSGSKRGLSTDLPGSDEAVSSFKVESFLAQMMPAVSVTLCLLFL